MKKVLKTIAVILLVAITAISVFACDGGTGTQTKKGLLYKKIDGVYTIYKYVDEGKGVTSLDIGEELKAKGVTADQIKIQTDAFKGNDTLTEITVPSTVTEIAKGAFSGMKKLVSITLPFVGMNAVADVTVGETIDEEDDGIVKSVDSERTIAHIFGDEDYDEGVNINVKYAPSDDMQTTCYVPLTLKNITIKAEGEYKIPMSAFNGFSKSVNIKLEGNITEIGEYAFADCRQLHSFVLPETVKVIHNSAFKGAINLKSFDFGKVEEIGKNAFEGVGLSSIVLPSSVKSVGSMAFKDAKLVSVKLFEVETLGNYVFYNCVKLKSVELGAVKSIGVYAFGDCAVLDTISFAGATTAWAKVTKGANWADGIKATTITCSDKVVEI